jgi:hypothetical protein
MRISNLSEWGFCTLSKNSSKSKTNTTTGKTIVKLVKIQSLRKNRFNIDELRNNQGSFSYQVLLMYQVSIYSEKFNN